MDFDTMNSGLITISPEAKLGDALVTMYTREVHHLIVVEGGRMQGVLSDRDILWKAFDQETMRLNPELHVRDVMARGVPILDEGTSFGDALTVMQDRHLSALPIRRGATVSIVTESDFLRLARKVLGRRESASLGQQLDVELSNPLVQSVMKLLSDIGI